MNDRFAGVMPKIQFLADGVDVSLWVEPIDRRRSLLSLAREQRVPILFNCEAGACGACVVEVSPLGPNQPLAPLTDAEHLFLAARPREETAGEPRLACQYRLDDSGDVKVIVATGVSAR